MGDGAASEAAGDVADGNQQISPLVLDLTGTGVNLTALSYNSPYFDLQGNGFARKTGWIGSGTGLLAIDRNGDGQINDITELFGQHGSVPDGFAALRALDSNGDGVIDANDAAFSQLRVWVNPEGDGAVHAGELLTLAQLGITSISLAATEANQVIAANTIKLKSSYTLADGTTRTIADAWFSNSATYTQPKTFVTLSADVAKLPRLVGHGVMTGLRAAMMGDPALKSLVATFAANPMQMSLAGIQAIMLEWSGSTAIDPSSRGEYFDARQLDFLEKHTGVAFNNLSYSTDWAGNNDVPRWRAAVNLREGWASAFDGIAARLLLQGGYSVPEFHFNAALDFVSPATTLAASLASLQARLGAVSTANAAQWETALRVADAFRLDAHIAAANYLPLLEAKTSGSVAALASAMIYGLQYSVGQDGSITLTGATEHATLFAGPQVRSIQVQGVESLDPPPLGNTIVYAPGAGRLEISQKDYSSAPNNVLKFGAGITAAQIQVVADTFGNSYIADGTASDLIKLDGEHNGIAYGVQSVQFADGTTWTKAQLANMETDGFTWKGTTPGVTLTGSDLARNTFIFGPGGDTAIGGSQDNTYVFGKGDGQATIDPNGGNGALQFGADIPASDVYFQANAAGDLIIGLRDDPKDTLTVKGDFIQQWWGVQSQISQVTFGDGTAQRFGQSYWDQGQPFVLTWFGTANATVLAGSGWGSNTFVLGAGGDQVTFGNGSQGGSNQNTVLFGQGDGQAAVNVNGGFGTLKLGSGIAAQDVLLAANDAGDLTVSLRGDPTDSITFKGDLSGQWWGVRSQVNAFGFSDGTTQSVKQSYWDANQPIAFTQVGTAARTVLTGSNWGANTFELGAGGDQVTFGNGSQGGSNQNTVLFGQGDGQVTIDLNGGVGTLQFGADIPASDLYYQTDVAGDLFIGLRDDPKDTLTVKGDLSRQWWGVQSQVSAITFGDGTAHRFGQSYWDQGQPLVLTWIGTAGNTVLTGSNWGANTFELGAGGDQVTFGNSSQGGSGSNTVLFDKGDGQAIVATNGGTGTLRLGADISSSDVVLQADNAGNLVVALRDDPADSVTFRDDLVQHWWGVSSQVGQLAFADGTTLQLGQPGYGQGQPLAFTWVGTAATKALVGSNFGANTFDLGAGGDAITFGNGSQGGSGSNTVLFDKGDGQATVATNGGTGTLRLGADISSSDVLVQADNAGNLVVALRDDPADSVTFQGDLVQHWWGVSSQVGQLAFADGTTLQLGQPGYGQGQPLAFTWVGTPSNTRLAGSGYGSNTFELGAGGDQITFGNGSQGGSNQNTVLFGSGDGQAAADTNGGLGALRFGPGILASDMLLSANDAGDLTVSLRGNAADSITFKGDLSSQWWGVQSQVNSFGFGDGTTQSVRQSYYDPSQPIAFTQVGTTAHTVLTGSNWGANTFELGAGGDQVTFGNGSRGGSNQNTVLFGRGDG